MKFIDAGKTMIRILEDIDENAWSIMMRIQESKDYYENLGVWWESEKDFDEKPGNPSRFLIEIELWK